MKSVSITVCPTLLLEPAKTSETPAGQHRKPLHINIVFMKWQLIQTDVTITQERQVPVTTLIVAVLLMHIRNPTHCFHVIIGLCGTNSKFSVVCVNKQSRTADKGWSFNLQIGRGMTPRHRKNHIVMKCAEGLCSLLLLLLLLLLL
jgi:hypothetical protein